MTKPPLSRHDRRRRLINYWFRRHQSITGPSHITVGRLTLDHRREPITEYIANTLDTCLGRERDRGPEGISIRRDPGHPFRIGLWVDVDADQESRGSKTAAPCDSGWGKPRHPCVTGNPLNRAVIWADGSRRSSLWRMAQ